MSVDIRISHALKKYGDNVIIPDLSVNINPGEFFTLLGPSGCGKTTLLRMIAGFNSIEGGDFYFGDKRINDLDPAKRNLTKKLLLDYMAEKECSVIISSHNLHELADMCDHIALINGQKIAINCAVDDMNGSRCKFRAVYDKNVDRNVFSGIDLKNYKTDGKIVSFTVSDNIDEAERIIAESNPLLVERFPLSLEEIFLEEMEDTDYDFSKLFA